MLMPVVDGKTTRSIILTGILTGISIWTLQIICLSPGQFAKIILFAPLSTVGVISDTVECECTIFFDYVWV